MKSIMDAKEWKSLIGKGTVEVRTASGDISWIFEMLGWEKDVKRRN